MSPPAIDAALELSIRAHPQEVRRASSWLEQAGSEWGVPAEQIGRLDLCLNEALANILSHGGAFALSSPIGLRLEMRGNHGTYNVTVTVSDAGAAFNPLDLPTKPRPNSLAEAEPGGLGVAMIRTFADHLRYHHDNGCNRLTFGVTWTDSK